MYESERERDSVNVDTWACVCSSLNDERQIFVDLKIQQFSFPFPLSSSLSVQLPSSMTIVIFHSEYDLVFACMRVRNMRTGMHWYVLMCVHKCDKVSVQIISAGAA